MDLLVLFIGSPNLTSLRAVPKSIAALECSPENALELVRQSDAKHVLLVERQAYLSAQTYAAALTLDADGGMLGGCAIEGRGSKRFGSVFAAVPFGPYEVEPFALIDAGAGGAPAPDAIDVTAPGIALVDRAAFVELGGLNAKLGNPWRGYDLCLRFREAGKRVRWDPRLTYTLEIGIVSPSDAADHRDFICAWGKQLGARFDLETPARGGIRRAIRSPFGQRETLTVVLPPTDVVLYGEGVETPQSIRAKTRVARVNVRDARGEPARGVQALRDALLTRSDRYLAVVDAGVALRDGWLERMLVELESGTSARGVRGDGCALFTVARIPLGTSIPDGSQIGDAIEFLLRPVRRTRQTISIVYVAHARTQMHYTSFEGVYGTGPDIEYHVVVTSARPESVDALSKYSTLEVVVDDSRGMAGEVNAALARARGEIVIVLGDDFFPPPGWLSMIREAFALRPDMGVLGISAVFVDGPQCVDLTYADTKDFKMLAATRRETLARDARLTDRLGGLALAFDAEALKVVGGFDERLGAGRWGIEDLTLRMRAAGYSAYVAEDLFLHRFTPAEGEPFLNDPEEEKRRAQVFAKKWGLPAADPANFDAGPLIARGFDPARDFVPLVDAKIEARTLRPTYGAVFVGTCTDEAGLEALAPVLRRYFRAFSAQDDALLAIGVGDDLKLEEVSARARAILRKTERTFDDAPDVAILRMGKAARWLEELPAGPRHRLDELDDLSPSGLRRVLA